MTPCRDISWSYFYEATRTNCSNKNKQRMHRLIKMNVKVCYVLLLLSNFNIIKWLVKRPNLSSSKDGVQVKTYFDIHAQYFRIIIIKNQNHFKMILHIYTFNTKLLYDNNDLCKYEVNWIQYAFINYIYDLQKDILHSLTLTETNFLFHWINDLGHITGSLKIVDVVYVLFLCYDVTGIRK